MSEEVSRWLFVWMTFLGAIVALREHGHLGVDTLVKRLPLLGKKVCLVASQLLMLYATWLFLQGSWQQTEINLGVTAPASGLSVAWFYGVGRRLRRLRRAHHPARPVPGRCPAR